MMLIVDGNNMAYRALHTMSLTTSKGKDVSILYGVLNMLKSLLEKHHPRSLVVCFDGGTPPIRRKILPQYKAHRGRDEDTNWDDVFSQISELRRNVLPLHGARILWAPQVEADDLMAWSAKLSTGRPYIVTTDEDLLQCVDLRTSVINPHRGKIYTADNFEKELGVPVGQWLAYKALTGDSSDNIPGIMGIGPKTAQKMLKIANQDGVDLMDYTTLQWCRNEFPGLTSRQRKALGVSQACWEGMLDVMDLSIDIVGAKFGIVTSKPWMAAKSVWIKKWLFRHEFLTMMGAAYYTLWEDLQEPIFSFDGIKVPSPLMEREAI